jgi:Protein of unknown function (DUF4054)
VDPITFKARFPEFNRLPDVMIQDAINRGVAQTNANVFGPLQDEASAYLAAHFLALSPYGQQARLVSKDGSTTYFSHWLRIAQLKSAGYARVTGNAAWPRPWGCW